MAAAGEVEKIELEHTDYDISTKGFIDDIDEIENKNEERIKNKELEDEHIYWLEEKLVPIIEELSRRTGITISEKDKKN
ncbi:MAG: hypothetical protein ACRD5E_08885 [Nitrososphaeraceae archaeon]